MGEKQPEKARGRRRLSRRQVQDILERNVKLYKDEESFVSYVIELTLYLLEYEYDWDESSAAPPLKISAREAQEEGAIAAAAGGGGGTKGFQRNPTPTPQMPGEQICVHCGEHLHGEFLCPNCRNLTR